MLRRAIPPLLFAATFACFLPALHGEFLNWDDEWNFLRNPHYRGFSADNLRWMFTDFRSGFVPLSWLSLALDHSLWEMRPAGYHLTSMLLHSTNAVLAYLLILALLRAEPAPKVRLCAAAGALLFALHPLRVESVAWITERRDVLSGLLLLLTVLAYLKRHDASGAARARWYAASIACFALSLFAKGAGMVLPAVLVVIDLRLGRPLRQSIADKVPYALLGAGALVLAFAGLRDIGALEMRPSAALQAVQPPFRLSFYLGKTIAPVALSPLYLFRPDESPLQIKYAIGIAATGVLVAVILAVRRRTPMPMLAFAAFAILLAPSLGIPQAGAHYAADRYTYAASLAPAALAAAGLLRCTSRAAFAAAGGALAALAVLTHAQTGVWHDSLSLWEHALRLDASNHVAYLNRATARAEVGDLDGAMADCDRALLLQPRFALAHNGRAVIHAVRGDRAAAIAEYDASLRLEPRAAITWQERGRLKQAEGDLDGAIADFTAGLAASPASTGLLAWRALAWLAKGDAARARADLDDLVSRDPRNAAAYVHRARVRRSTDEAGALADLDRAVELAPASPAAWYERGVLRQQRGDVPGATADFSRAIAVQPAFADALRARAQLRRLADDQPGALADYTAAIAARPRDADARYGRALVFEDLRDPESALADYTAAITARAGFADAHFARAALLARLGSWDAAIADLDVVTRLRPADAAAFALRGDAHAARKDWKGAAADYETAQRLGADVATKLKEARDR